MRANYFLLTASLLLLANNAAAHSIFLECESTDNQIACRGGFSDGSAASNLPFEVISYEEETLLTGTSNDESRFSFAAPQAEYFILLDAGPGHVVEVDMTEVVEN